ncbi:peptidase [Streptomyces sp. A3M-1-3]|uniref:Clp protease N-terminal domain-containing protein n=1 Tax=Streptomyces sp. A3M-1-3 TaxID=2962044 RepID=UPI0020B76821|nr:Clp protease N-terminal domain-containing protein [Streptomyces sp. A3M-1-3]MCP3821348.1 peptidase [Streptomyces sp. A3M-1-3]
MQSPTRPVRLPGPAGADIEARLTEELATVVAGARRRALCDGDRQTDTAHLLHSLLEADRQVRAALGGTRLARLLGYLVQRSIGYGLRWQGTVEGSGAVGVVPAAVPAVVPGHREPVAADWSPSAAGVLGDALERARRRGGEPVAGLDLLAALVADRGCRAVEVLRRAGVDADAPADRIWGPSQQVSQG